MAAQALTGRVAVIGGGAAFAVREDLTKISEIACLFDEPGRRFAPATVAIDTFGKAVKTPILDTTDEDYNAMFAVNAKAAYFVIREAARRIPEHGERKIVTILTSLPATFTGLYPTYAGSKAPVEDFTHAATEGWRIAGRTMFADGGCGAGGHS